MHMAFLGQESQWAAEASECAADQNAFWAYHDKLFASQAGENQGAFNKDKLKAFAGELGLEPKAFNDCLDSGKYTQLVQSQSAAAAQLGVTGTPSFFVNDWPTGAVSVAEFGKLFDKAKQGIHPPPTPTPLPAGVQFYDSDPNRPGLTYDGSPTQGDAKAPVLLLAFEDLKSGDAAQYVKGIEPALVDKYINERPGAADAQALPDDSAQGGRSGILCAGSGQVLGVPRCAVYPSDGLEGRRRRGDDRLCQECRLGRGEVHDLPGRSADTDAGG